MQSVRTATLALTLLMASSPAVAEKLSLACYVGSDPAPFTVRVNTTEGTVVDRGEAGKNVKITDDLITYFRHSKPNADNSLWRIEIDRWTGNFTVYNKNGQPLPVATRCVKQQKAL